MVIVEVIDFTIHKNEFKVVSEISSDHDDSNNNIQYLLNLLKKTIRKNRYKQFSLKFEPLIDALENVPNSYNYDVVICERYNIVIATQEEYLLIYNRIESSKPPIPYKIQFKVDFTICLRCLKLNEEVDGDYLYVSTYDNSILKINLTQLMITKEKSIIWQSEKFENVWGIDILHDRVYAVDHNTGIIVLDCEDGKTITNPKPKLPIISTGFQIIFISSTEMIISHDQCVELYHLKTSHWESMKKTSFPIGQSDYPMFYERESKLIYLAGSSAGGKLKVINGEDLSLVKSFDDFIMNFGMCIDRLSGLLYVCDTCNYIIKVYQ